MKETIPINPDVLRWARITANLSIEEVVLKLKRKRITGATIEAWEEGDGCPSYSQLEELAYKIYKRPLALFFFPEPPMEESPEQSFRTLPEYEISKLSSRFRYLIRQARVMQINLSELNDYINPALRQIYKDFNFEPTIDVSEMSNAVREYLQIDIITQSSWRSTDQAFKSWRNCLEESGIFVFKDAFRDDAISGFCLYDDKFPIIYVNNSMPDTRQIFTLFHELAHLLFRTGGIDARQKDYIGSLVGDDKKIETICNKFAGEFLVPNNDFEQRIVGIKINERNIENLARRYHVSREVVLRKLLDHKLISKDYYEKKVEEWATRFSTSVGGGGNYYLNKGVYLGYRYIEIAFLRYYQKHISVDQLANYLGVKVKSVTGMEALFQKQGIA